MKNDITVHSDTEDYTSEWQWQFYYLKLLFRFSKNSSIDAYSFRSVFIFFCNFQFVYFLLNSYFHNEIALSWIEYIKTTESLAVYYPTFELYFTHTLFFSCLIITLQYTGLLLLLALQAYILSSFKGTGFQNNFKKSLIYFSCVPILFILPYWYFFFIIIYAGTIYRITKL